MPSRREPFTTMTIVDAVAMLLNRGGDWHADDVVKAIFVVNSPKDLKLAKRSVASTLAFKAKEGMWDRADRPNTFRANVTTPTLVRAEMK